MAYNLSQDFDQIDYTRALDFFEEHQVSIFKRTDKMFAVLLPLQCIAAIFISAFVSPYAWSEWQNYQPDNLKLAFVFGGTVTAIPTFLAIRFPGAVLTRYSVAVSQMLLSGLLIHLTAGRIETHFHIFGSLAFLSFYRDWRILIPATLITVLDHYFRGLAFPFSMYGIESGGEWRWLEHFGWIVFEDVILIVSINRTVFRMWQSAFRNADVEAQEEKYRAVVEQTSDGIAIIEPENLIIIECNEAFSRLLGCQSIEEAKTMKVKSADCENDWLQKDRLMQNGSRSVSVRKDTNLCRHDGTYIPVESTVNFITYAGRQVFCVNLKDITERKCAEIELRRAQDELEARVAQRTAELSEAQQFLRKVIDSVPNLIFVKDENRRFKLVNQATADFHGTTTENMVGKTFREFNSKESIALDVLEEEERLLKNFDEIVNREQKLTDAQGNPRWLHVIKVPLKLTADDSPYILGIVTDLTERRLLENQLRHSQKMESIGQLAAGIAHEINTPAQYVSDNTLFVRDSFTEIKKVLEKFDELLKRTKAGEIDENLISALDKKIERCDLEFLTEEIPNAVEQSLEGVSRISKIVQSMRTFAHPGAIEKQPADINKAIETTISVAHNEWKYVAELETVFDESLPPVPCLLDEFNRVILNMIINATHSIADVIGKDPRIKGKITIKTSRIADRWAEIQITDTGAGIPPEVQNRIFDPFFTTKEVGKGTGQGLAISHNVIVEKHKGQILFESEQGYGTTFYIRLPLQEVAEKKFAIV